MMKKHEKSAKLDEMWFSWVLFIYYFLPILYIF